MTEEKEKARIIEIEKKLIVLLDEEGNNYQIDHWPEHFKPEEAGTSDVFLVEWGTPGERVKRLVKVNKPKELLTSPRQIRHVVERGYDTGNDLKIGLSLNHPGVVKLVDYFDDETCRNYGLLGPVVVQDYFPDSCSLEELVKSNDYAQSNSWFNKAKEVVLGNPKKRKLHQEVREILLQSARTLRDLHYGKGVLGEKPIVHRDLKPSNILVRKNKEGLEVKLGDLGNASPLDSQKPGYNPTMGGHVVSDPNLMGVFSGEEREYTQQSDMYALISSILFYARGKPLVIYDPDTGEARDVDTWQSLVGKDGKIDKEKHREVVRRGVKALPSELRGIAEKVLSLYDSERYVNTNLFLQEVESAVKNPNSTLKRVGIGLVAGGLLTGALVGYSYFHETKKGLETQVQKAHDEAKFERRYKAIDSWQRIRVDRNLREDPENNNRIFFTPEWNDGFEDAELGGWMDLFYHWEYKDRKQYGDFKTAVAAYLDSTLDNYPEVVFEALMKVNGIKDSKDLVKRLKEHDTTLNLDYKVIGEEIRALDEQLWNKVNTLECRGSDNIYRMVCLDRRQGVEIKLDCASEIYDLKRQREAEIKRVYEEINEKNKKTFQGSGILGDVRQLNIDSDFSRAMREIDKKYEAKYEAMQRGRFK